MPTVITYNPETREIVSAEDIRTADTSDGEYVVMAITPEDVAGYTHVKETSPPLLIQSDDFTRSESVDRGKMSENSIDNFRNARASDDTQTQLDILFEILTGKQP